MLGKTRSLNILPIALFLAFADVCDAWVGRGYLGERSFC